MSYVSLLKNIPEFLSQPTGIAALASVGIHGAIAFIMPLVPVDSNKPNQQVASSKTVGLVELNQAEQNRLPGSAPKIALKPLPLQSQVPALPNFVSQPQSLPPLPPPGSTTQLVLPPLPTSPTNLSVSSLPKGQSLRIIPKQDFQVHPINSSLNTGVIAAQPPLPRFQENVRLGESQPLPPSNLPELQASQTPTEVSPSSLAVQPVRTSVELPSSDLSVQPVRRLMGTRSNLPQLQAAKVPAELQSLPSSIPSDATSTATASYRIVPQNRQLVAPIGETPQNRGRLTLAEPNLVRSQLQSYPNVPVLPSTPKESVTTKTMTFGEQFHQVKQQYPNLETKLPISGTINAKAGQEGSVDGALVVNAEGKVESVTFLNNSVSSDLRTVTREYLREYFQNNPSQANGKPKYYPFSLSFRANSSSIPETLKQTFPRSPQVGSPTQGSTSSVINPTQTASELRQRLIQRLRVSPVGTQPSNQQPASLSEHLRPSQVNAQPLQPRQVSRSSPQVNRNSQSTPTTQATPQPASEPKVSSNQPSTSIESGQKLLRRLRELREQRSHQEQ